MNKYAISAALILGLALVSASVIAAIDTHRDAANQVAGLLHMDRLIEQSYEQTIDAQIIANPDLKPYRELLLDFFRRHMNWDALKEDLLDLYVESFSEAELHDLIAFYSTDTGQKAVLVMPDLLRRGAELGVQRVQEHLPELENLLHERAQRGQ
ncbi:MAG TPA: DUF2059 domain-containing protein [Candidatus Hydrogenedentes bacterium]|nr:DUF2059 domain-containing protein [Candidatus Hydrogenedentota bacterium]